MAHNYHFMVKYFHPSLPDAKLNFAEEYAQQTLENALQQAEEDLKHDMNTLLGRDGWEVNSHNLAIVGNIIIVSILLQRHSK